MTQEHKNEVSFSFNGHNYVGRIGTPVGYSLWENGVKTLRTIEGKGIYCGTGQCYECRLFQENVGMVRACLAPIEEGASFHSEEVK